MSASESILIVDPLAVIREALAAAVQAQGYLTLTAGDGEEAYEVAAFCPPSVVILDLALPGMNGVELIRRWRKESAHPETPIILLIDGSDLSAVQQATKLGVSRYLLKSKFTMACLMEMLDKLCPVAKPEPVLPPKPSPKTQPPPPKAAAPPPTPTPKSKPRSAPPAYHHDVKDNQVLKSLSALVTRPEIDQVIEDAYRLPILDSSRKRLRELLDSDEGSLHDAAAIVNHDPTLALHVLREANDERFGDADPAVSITQSLGRLGLGALRELLESLETWALPTAAGIDFDGAGFWQHSVAVATITAELVREAEGRPDEIDTAYTAGLIHDAGRLVLASRVGPRYAEVLETADALRSSLTETEAHLLLETHATLMDKVLRRWGCGPELANPVGLHHTPPSKARHLAGASNDLLNTLRFADTHAHALLLGHCGDDAITSTDGLLKPQALSPGRLRVILETLPEKIDVARKLALPAEAVENSVVAGKRLLAGHDPMPRPVFVGVDPEFDAVAQLVGALNDDPGTANIAVAHLRSVRERTDIGNLLRTADNQAGGRKLPVLVLSPKGNIELDENVTLGRAVRHLAMPVHPKALIKHMTKLAQSLAQAA